MKTFWETSASTLGLPLPRRHYASPLARCLETCELAFSGLTLPPPPPSSSSPAHQAGEIAIPPFKPVIKELLRERLGVHTCDRRRTRTWIRENHPLFAIEDDGFSEQDELWRPDVRETLLEHAARAEGFLEDLFANDDGGETIVSVTAHSGTIQALYAATGHEEVRVAPGTIVPVLIKAEYVAES
jgi:broad specificity phosphatase PhoE